MSNLISPGPIPSLVPAGEPSMLPAVPAAQEMLKAPALITQAATTRVAHMQQMFSQPTALQNIVGSGMNVLKGILPVGGIVLATWLGVQMILTGGPPKFLKN